VAGQFQEFMRQREAASNDYIRGDAAAVAAMLTHQDPATFMPPSGAVVESARAVEEAKPTVRPPSVRAAPGISRC
jgi:hypothetical protein